jgi:hypothetical protein
MIKHTKTLARTVALVVAGCLASCNSTIDKEPNVVLEAETVTIPPVTSTANGPNNSCTFLVTVANGTFKNKPKNQFAGTSPFNDIILQNVRVTYVWDDAVTQAPVTAGLAGSVPANGSTSVQFNVVSNAALLVDGPNDPAGTGRAGHTASLGLTFNGETVSGDAVSTTTGGTLQVNSCTVNLGACCGGIGSSGCTDGQSSQACTTAGGTYQGDFTTCATLPNSCP